MAHNSSHDGALAGVIRLLIVAAASLAAWRMFPSAPPVRPVAPMPTLGMRTSTAGAAVKGDLKAKVVVVEFSDFQCPFCATFAGATQESLFAKYVESGKVLWAFRHLPLTDVHPIASKAAEAAACAGQQHRFWEAHDVLFRNQRSLATADLLSLVAPVSSDRDAIQSCIEGGAMTQRIVSDRKEAARLGVTGTPTFLLGVRDPDGQVTIASTVSGARPLGDFDQAISSLLNR